ncbi:recombinase family protein [Pseudomonas aeruginosa]|uniref:recombinase family protein n=1 Tax=Pseudomonas aeruginosa TaxID=287 RepID=UPI0014046770|nr:recombinase family protein [Pseudomonas aeruginosa]
MDNSQPNPTRKVLYKYIRFSSIQQSKGSSFARQNARLEKYAQENGFEIDDSLDLRDFAKSGFHGINKEIDQGLGRFILAIEKGLIPTDGSAYLAVEQFDRISREDIDKAQDLFKSILRKNVNIITLMDGRIYTKKSLSNFMEVLYSLFLMEQAHQESLKKSDRIKGAYTNKIKKLKELNKEQKAILAEWEKNKEGKKPEFEPLINQVQYSSQIPYWIDQKTEVISGRKFIKFIINEEKASVIRYALSLLNDDNGYMNVAARLNKEGIPRIDYAANKKRSTRKDIWTNRAVNEFVNSDAIYGDLAIYENFYADKEFEYEGTKVSKKVGKRIHIENIPNYYPAVVDKKLIMGLRARANAKKKGRIAGRTTNNNLFQNLLFCGKCGDSMHLIQSKRETKKGTYQRFYLTCYSARHKACDAKMISYTELEREIVKYLVMPFNESKMSGTSKVISDSRNEKLLELEGEIKAIEDQIEAYKAEMKNNKNIKPSIALTFLSELETDKDYKTHQLKELQLQKDQTIESIESENVSNFDIEKEEGRIAFKVAVKQRYAGFFVFTEDQVVMVVKKTGSAGFFKIEVRNRRNKLINPERTADTFKLFQEKLNHIRNLSKTYKEGKLYNIIKAYKINDIEIFEEEYINRGLPQPISYNRFE